MTPAVSVCIPVYNGADHIAEVLESILAQTWTDFELVVVDQDSTDGTVDIVESFDDPRIRLVHNLETKGLAPNWTRAVEESRGPLIKMVCANDPIKPTCLERQVKALTENPSAVLAACRREIVDHTGRVLLAGRGLAGMSGLVDGSKAISRCVRSGSNALGEPSAIMIRADVWKRCLPFTDRYPFMIDIELWLRALEHGDLIALPEVLAVFTVHGDSVSTRSGAGQAREARALFREVRGRTFISRADMAIGSVNAELLRWARALIYRRASI